MALRAALLSGAGGEADGTVSKLTFVQLREAMLSSALVTDPEIDGRSCYVMTRRSVPFSSHEGRLGPVVPNETRGRREPMPRLDTALCQTSTPGHNVRVNAQT